MDFKSAYSRTAYTTFFRDSLLPEDYLVLSETVEIEFGSKYFKQVTFLGRCPSLDLNVYEITHSSLSDARVGLSRDAFKLIARQMENNALILFVPENADNYRLSLVTIDPKLDSEGIKILKEYSNPRRFSFALGKGIKTHTIEQFLVKAGRISSIDDLKKRFSVELLTKEFYNELSNWYFWALQNVKFPNDSENDDAVLNATSTIRLITRIMFVWFLKQKGIIPDILFDKDALKSVLNYTDKTNSNYYKAILQNLFFATLNQEMNARAFRRDGDQYNITNLYRYRKLFLQNEAAFKLFENIPFLNGGLFECLDKPHQTQKTSRGGDVIVRIDGFSDREDNVLCVPDFLFFGGSADVDLNQAYGDKTHGKICVKGLIDILSTYNFTIEENTPVEIEVALDPELLGKVFENLLASYNPETKSTARKQTGSFYTPRDIVNYMVDESLAVYLRDKMLERTKSISVLGSNQIELFGNETRKGQLKLEQDHSISKWSGKEDTLEQDLKQLLSYDHESNPFDKQDSALLMHILDNCKILDPACGSGAFPMGVLQKMVHILQKLDKDNHHWQKIQEERAKTENAELIRRIEKDKEYAAQISFEDIRRKLLQELDDRLNEIKKSFDLNANEPDYARKLFLIENCIYGVDIQPIAVQIAKLRFFISLVIDQKIDDALPNRGILTLPNLETKFLAANSLIGLDQNSTAKPLSVYPMEKQLKEVRHKHFSARTPETKRKYRELDSTLRLQISNELKGAGFHPTSADKIANWDPYNQNSSAGFFDREWMFGLSEGFDVVIGNPPYLRIQGVQEATPELIPFAKKHYESAQKGNWDLYVLFTEAGYIMLKQNGILSYIQPHKFFQGDFGVGIRNFVAKEKCLYEIVHFGDEQMFESATNYTCLFFMQKKVQKTFRYIKVDKPNEWLQNTSSAPDYILPQPVKDQKWAFTSGEKQNILDKLKQQPQTLDDITRKIFVGLQTSADKIYVLKIKEWKDKTVVLFSVSLDREVEIEIGLIKPFLMGKDVKRYEKPEPISVVIFPYVIKENKAALMSQEYIKDHFPLGWQYLLDNRTELENREKGKMKHESFYAYIYPKNLTEFDAIKIITPEIAIKPQLTLDSEGICYHTTKVYSFVFKENIDEKQAYWLGLLNSKLLWFFLNSTGYVLRGGYFTFKTEYLKPFPAKRIDFKNKSEKFCYDKIIENVNTILEFKEVGKDTFRLEAEIDAMVFILYGFTEDEMMTTLLQMPDVSEAERREIQFNYKEYNR